MYKHMKLLSAHVRQSLSWPELKRSRYHFAAFYALYLLASWMFDSWFAGGATTFVVLFTATHLHARYARALAARVGASNSPTWDVEVNQVKVGTITDADYAAIQLRAACDFGIYVAQVGNLLRVLSNLFDYCFRAIPLALFWIGVATVVLWPESVSSVLTALQSATASDIKHAASMVGTALTVMMLLSVMFHWMFRVSNFGFVDRFGEAIGTAIRQHCGVAAEGSIVIRRWSEGGYMSARTSVTGKSHE